MKLNNKLAADIFDKLANSIKVEMEEFDNGALRTDALLHGAYTDADQKAAIITVGILQAAEALCRSLAWSLSGDE